MKKIKNKFHVLLNSLLTALLGLFSISCDMECLYGSPHADYDVSGEVTNQQGEPLESMQVAIKTTEAHYWFDTVYTNAAGQYDIQIGLSSFGGDCLEVVVNDTTGEFESDILHIPPKKMHLVEQTEWTVKYAVDADFQLKKK